MEYHISFEDGSEYLMHHGTKGMKWGVWNEETKARRTGGAYNRLMDKKARQYADKATKGVLDAYAKSKTFTKAESNLLKSGAKNNSKEFVAYSNALRDLDKSLKKYRKAELKAEYFRDAADSGRGLVQQALYLSSRKGAADTVMRNNKELEVIFDGRKHWVNKHGGIHYTD